MLNVACLFIAVSGTVFPAQPLPPKPRLVVVFSIDQCRADYISRFAVDYLPANKGSTIGGFNYLASKGAYFTDSHFRHIPTYTGPGHAVILTGSIPALTGIADNDWFDRSTGKIVYCVDDPQTETVGGTSGPMSPRNLKVTTVGDELKMATAGKAKVVGISFKDRAAILMAGHAADTVIWFDGGAGKWVTSAFYAPNKKLPVWVDAVNSLNRPDASETKVWTPMLPDAAYADTRPAPFVKGPPTSPVFSHKIAGSTKKATYGNFTASGFGQEFVFETVQRAVEAEGLGQDEVPDILCVNLATNDYIGHAYGPNSPEVKDISVRTDRLLSGLFNFLRKQVPGGMASVAVVVTADHGVVPIPEEASGVYRILQNVRGSTSAVEKAVNETLSKRFGEGKWVLNCSLPQLYLDRALVAAKGLTMAQAEEVAAEAARTAPGVYWAFPGEDILHGALPTWPWTAYVTNGYHPKISGDVMVFEDPGVLFSGGTGTSHGSPWAYDTHVPILVSGPGIRPGVYSDSVSQSDIAPTLCQLLRIEQPSGCVGKPLVKALGN